MTSRMDQIGQNGNDGLHYDRDDDLDWLARNVHEWPASGGNGGFYCRWIESQEEVYAIAKRNKDYTFYTKNEWLNRRAELQNKPSWDDAPEWAEYLAQDADGSWAWFEFPCVQYAHEWMESEDHDGYIRHAGAGEVVGDWRNTLEKRSEKRELNPPTSSLHHTQAVEIAKETGMCSDGEPCGHQSKTFAERYCDDCPNDPDQSEQPLDMAKFAFVAVKKEGNHDPLSDLTVSVKPTAHADMINRPPHYQLRPGYEVYDLRQDLAAKAQQIGLPHDLYSDWDRALEYLLRCWEKNELEDIKKARWYLDKIIGKLE